MKLPCFASHSVIAVLLSVCRVSALTVRGSVGQEVTLPCRYSVRDLGVTTMCWGRGELPLSGCNNMIISTDGQSVNSRLSERYQLLGQLTGGDVSLTILHAQESDSGLYGCRVEIPGWFNDQKHTVNLIVTKEAVPAVPTEESGSPAPTGGAPHTSYPASPSPDASATTGRSRNSAVVGGPCCVDGTGAEDNAHLFNEDIIRLVSVIAISGLILLIICGMKRAGEAEAEVANSQAAAPTASRTSRVESEYVEIPLRAPQVPAASWRVQDVTHSGNVVNSLAV
ncbi:hepatitis A virus cellular receptor 1 homolog isoform X5 [Lepisosteus oculatus]|uniref:hepatitis A virus cellular receptor 1 homolog isoform X5 n=1 Tax=Lepisosteus oculatus TaxID=7918 RepID=UPI0035F52927